MWKQGRKTNVCRERQRLRLSPEKYTALPYITQALPEIQIDR